MFKNRVEGLMVLTILGIVFFFLIMVMIIMVKLSEIMMTVTPEVVVRVRSSLHSSAADNTPGHSRVLENAILHECNKLHL